jgi:hypothetical protein
MRAWLGIFFCLCSISAGTAFEKAVTYEQPGGRLGDQLIAYMHAKWISYRYQIPLLYKPFSYSNELILDEEEEVYLGSLTKTFQHIVRIENNGTVEENAQSAVLFIAQYFPESSYEMKLFKWPSFAVDWTDAGFISLLRSLIRPKQPAFQPALPCDRVTIAAHIRRGGGFDDPNAALHWPLKFPPDSFYIEEIRHIYELVQRPLFVHIFTDDLAPNSIAEKYQSALADIDVVFDYRCEGNSYKTNVLADLFDMMRYACLIRPESNYSIVAEKLGDYKMIVHPTECHIQGKDVIITGAKVSLRSASGI